MSNLRAKARDNEVSTPLYPSISRTLRPSASNGALLSSRPTIRAVQPSPVILESPIRSSPHKDTSTIIRNNSLSRVETEGQITQGSQLTEQNLRIQERLEPLSLREGSEEQMNLERKQALDKTLKFGKDLLHKIDKDNLKHPAHPGTQTVALQATAATVVSSDQIGHPNTLELTGGDVVKYTEGQTPTGFVRPRSRGLLTSQTSNTSSGRGFRAGHHHREGITSRTVVIPRIDVITVDRSPRQQRSAVSRQTLRHTASLADMHSNRKIIEQRPISRASVQPGLTPYRSFPALQAATNLATTRENGARTPHDGSHRNVIPSRPTTSQSNKQKETPAGSKKPPGGYGRDLKWA